MEEFDAAAATAGWTWTNENGYDQYWVGGHTRYCNSHEQVCASDTSQLTCEEDYYGGGSHYWVLRCPDCRRRYTYDTYRWECKEWPDG